MEVKPYSPSPLGTPSFGGGELQPDPLLPAGAQESVWRQMGLEGGRGEEEEEEEAENNAGRLPAVGEQGGGLPPWPPRPRPMAPSLEDSEVPCQQGELGAGRGGKV